MMAYLTNKATDDGSASDPTVWGVTGAALAETLTAVAAFEGMIAATGRGYLLAHRPHDLTRYGATARAYVRRQRDIARCIADTV